MGSNYVRLLIVSALFSWVFTSAQEFTWKKGDQQVNKKGIYGQQGIAAATNIPGARGGAAYWQDGPTKFWIFGGEGRDYVGNIGLLNDLWQYDLATNQWVWVKGDDFIAQLGTYGTKGVAAGTNKPGCRTGAVSWADANGKFWIFGGYGYDSQAALGYLSDLWKFDPTTNNWTWVSGSNLINQSGTYGTIGTTSPGVMPGARVSSIAWKDNNGLFYLFGGMGYNNLTTVGSLNDVWTYNFTTDAWTWMGGTNGIDQAGTYGTMGTPAASNIPGSRKSATGWLDNVGNFWLLGGFGKDASAVTSGYLNDLWRYNSATNEWTWVHGKNANGAPGTYGTIGVASPSNEPGARTEAAAWVDVTNTLWLLGGEGFSGTNIGKLNDLWMYNIGTNQWTWVRSTSLTNQTGVYGILGIQAPSNKPGGRNQTASWIDSKDNLYLFGGEGYGSSSTPEGHLNDLWKYSNCFVNPITLTITAQDSVLCAGESTSLTVTGSNNYLWLNNSSTASYIVIKPNSSTSYTVLSSNDNGCIYSSVFTETISACQNIQYVKGQNNLINIYPNPNNGAFKLRTEGNSATRILIVNALGQLVFEKQLSNSVTDLTTELKPGVYLYQVHFAGEKTRSAKLIVE